MTDEPTPEDTALWQRRLASQANNRAWQLAESPSRTPEEDDEMRDAAHAARYFWNRVGHENNRAHAAQLLAHVHATLKSPDLAERYLALSAPVLLADSAQPWERALAQAVASNVAAAAGDRERHRAAWRRAVELVAALADPEDRAILENTLRVLPVPDA